MQHETSLYSPSNTVPKSQSPLLLCEDHYVKGHSQTKIFPHTEPDENDGFENDEIHLYSNGLALLNKELDRIFLYSLYFLKSMLTCFKTGNVSKHFIKSFSPAIA